jgi:hypothetical protein
MSTDCTIEAFVRQGNGHVERRVSSISESELMAILDRLTEHWSTSIQLARDSQRLVLAASSGLFALTAMLGEDDFYDYVGSPDATGWTPFVHGGQPAEHPRRHCVRLEDVRRILLAFIRGQDIDRMDSRWERQGEFQDA